MNGLRTWIEIDTQALRHNVAVFRRLIGPEVKLMAVVKSNAYGHGLALVARALANPKFPARLRLDEVQTGGQNPNSKNDIWFGVDSIDEALELRKSRIRNSILILGYTLPERLTEAAEKRISVTISHFEGLRALARLKNQPAFHIKLDTGMHRQGFQEYEMPELVSALKNFRLKPQGVYSHFAAAENEKFSLGQISAFERCSRPCTLFCGRQKMLRHLAATQGAFYYPQAHYDMVRIGLGIYGYLPGNRGKGIGIRVRPVMSWKTIVDEVKYVKKGERIGYGLTERLKRDSVVAILPVGYWHGFDRGLSSVGEVLIHPVRSKTPAASAVPPLAERTSSGVHGKRAKVLGRVSMDMIAVDITDIARKSKFQNLPRPKGPGSRPQNGLGTNVKIGDEVVLIGRQGREFIGADELAKKLSTISYEVLTRINPLIERTKI